MKILIELLAYLIVFAAAPAYFWLMMRLDRANPKTRDEYLVWFLGLGMTMFVAVLVWRGAGLSDGFG